MSHKFKLRQNVRLSHSGFANARLDSSTSMKLFGSCRPIKQANPPIASSPAPIERAVRESEIRSV